MMYKISPGDVLFYPDNGIVWWLEWEAGKRRGVEWENDGSK